MEKNTLNLFQGKRSHEKISSGSRDFDRATKRSKIWQSTLVKGPIPKSPREDPRVHFRWLSAVGEETLSEVTLTAPDNSGVTVKCMSTRSFSRDYKCLSCPSRHSVLISDTITVLVGDQHCPESMPHMADGSCACVVRLSNISVEQLNYYIFGTLNNFGGNWENLKRFGVTELLLKIYEMGRRVFLGVVSGTECLEGGPVSYTNSAQVCFSQFMGKGLHLCSADLNTSRGTLT